MWALSRWVRADEALAQAVLSARVRNGKAGIAATPKTAEFEARWMTFLETYGWRSDVFFELGHRSWHEEPSTPLTQLKGYVGMGDEHDPFAPHSRFAAQRDELTAQFEARLPEEVKPDFRALLQMAQQYVPIAEDHNFTIDQKFTAVVRQAVLQLGYRLVEEGAVSDAEDVFYLVYDEIRSLADGGSASEFGARVRHRRREHARQASLKPPLLIGTPPPADAPPDPIVARFFGVGLVPSEDVNVVTGHACSTGVVTGIARVVPTLDDAAKLQPGDILVCRMTMPAWTPLFGVAGAVVADSGGPLSHCAIVAREYGIPCVAGTVNGTEVLRDGMRVRVDGGTGIVTVLSEKTRG
jgi:pyruvate,water dikinase